MDLATIAKELKARIRIEDLVSQFTELRWEGSRLKGICPFPHGGTPENPQFESTPSLMVNPEKQDFFCFGCHKGDSKATDIFGRPNHGSDVIAFWREIRQMQLGRDEGFRETLISLARHYGFTDLIPDEEEDSERARFLRVQQQRARRWHAALLRAPHVLAYLRERGVSEEVIRKFQLGFVTDANAGAYRFRLSIPIRHPYSGQVLAFSYRALDPEVRPKYMHSSSSQFWSAGEYPFGLYEAGNAITRARYVIVTEDFFGPLVLHSAGIHNVVGAMGNTIKENQAKMLRRYTDTLVWWAEDGAGLAGFSHMLPMLSRLGFKVYIADAGMDADEFALRYQMDTQAIKEAMARITVPALEWIVKQQREHIALLLGG